MRNDTAAPLATALTHVENVMMSGTDGTSERGRIRDATPQLLAMQKGQKSFDKFGRVGSCENPNEFSR
jgi:hypothetical protein